MANIINMQNPKLFQNIDLNITVGSYIKYHDSTHTTFHASSPDYTLLPNPYLLHFFCKGKLPNALHTGDNLTLSGHFVKEDVFKFTQAKMRVLAGEKNHEKILQQIRGIGTITAQKIVRAAYPHTFERIYEEGFLEDLGIKEKFIAALREGLLNYTNFPETQLFLNRYHLPYNDILRLYKTFGEQTISKVQENPYIFSSTIDISFKQVDQIAMDNFTFVPEDLRLQSATLSFVRELCKSRGHMFIYKWELLSQMPCFLKRYSSSRDPYYTYENREEDLRGGVTQALTVLEDTKQLVLSGEQIYLPYLYRSQNHVVKLLKRKIKKKYTGLDPEITSQIYNDLKQISPNLSSQQIDAVLSMMASPISILNGGPGTGKTYVLKYLIEMVEKYEENPSITLLAPTGRAAQQMAYITGHEASTIHKALNLGFVYKKKVEKLDTDIVVVDEASMIDMQIFEELLTALNPETKLILIGDSNQINSVAPGNILSDLIRSGKVVVNRLTKIFRQSSNGDVDTSLIIDNARKVIEQDPVKNLRTGESFRVRGGSTVLTEINELLQKGVVMGDVQVLCSMNKGENGVWSLNQKIKALFNPREPVGFIGMGEPVSLGDRVLQVVNDYNLGVFNGDLGVVVGSGEGWLKILFGEDKEVQYPLEYAQNLTLGYAITVHKSQGSEFRNVIIAAEPNYIMNRQLLYTGITRAKKRCILVGNYRILDDIEKIVAKEGAHRNSVLAELI